MLIANFVDQMDSDLVAKTITLGGFIFKEIQARHLTIRAFSRLVGVDNSTMLKFLKFGEEDVGYPSVDFVFKLAKATGVDVCYIMALIDPETTQETRPSIDAIATSQIIEQLPDHVRETIDTIIENSARKGRNNDK